MVRNFPSYLQNFSEVNPALYTVGIGVLTRVKRPGLRLTTYLRLMPRLGMSGAVPLPSPFAFIAWTGTNLLINFI